MSTKPFTEYVGRLHEIVYKPQTKTGKGGVVVYFSPHKDATSNMRIQLQRDENSPRCKSPFGVSSFDDSANASRKTLELSINDDDLVKFFTEFDEKTVDVAFKNAAHWFKQKDLTRDQLKNMYYPTISFDSSGKGYAPKLHTKLNTDGRNKVNVLLYSEDSTGKPQYANGKVEDIEKFSELMVIVEASSIWFQSKQFGMSLLVTDVVVFPKVDRPAFPFIWSKAAPTKALSDAVDSASVILCPPQLTEPSASVLLSPAESSSVLLVPLDADVQASKKQRKK